MNENDRLDLSALDPMRDPAHWRAISRSTLARVDAVLREREHQYGPLALIATWTRPMLVAAAIAVALLIPLEVALEVREGRAERVQRLVALSSAWASAEDPPSGGDFVRALAEGAQP